MKNIIAIIVVVPLVVAILLYKEYFKVMSKLKVFSRVR